VGEASALGGLVAEIMVACGFGRGAECEYERRSATLAVSRRVS
jgi:hypothetical protein